MYPYRRARALAAGRMRTEALRPWVHAARLDVYFQFAAALYSGAGPKYGFSDESKPGQGNARPRPRGVFNLLYSSNRHSSPQHPQPHVYTHMTQSLFQSRAVVGVEDQTDTSVQRAHRKQKRLRYHRPLTNSKQHKGGAFSANPASFTNVPSSPHSYELAHDVRASPGAAVRLAGRKRDVTRKI
jgi:hypothetical protein